MRIINYIQYRCGANNNARSKYNHSQTQPSQLAVLGLCGCWAYNVRVTRINDGERADSKVLATCSAQWHIVSTVVVNASLGKHGVVLDLTFPEWEKRKKIKVLVLQQPSSHLNGGALLARMTSLAFPSLRVLMVDRYPRVYLPLFITRARRELMLSMAFF